MDALLDLSTLPAGILIAAGAALIVQVTLAVIALVDLYRRPIAAVALGSKWAWVAIILLANLLGPILYFAIGRKPSASVVGPSESPRRSSAEIADALYGSRDEPRQP